MDAKEKAAALKRAGFINYDLRKSLSAGQKSYITKQWKKHSAVITHPGNFIARTVSAPAAAKMKADGYDVAGRKVYISKEGYETATVKSRKEKGKPVQVLITRKLGRKTSKTRVYTEMELLRALEKAKPETLPPGKMITVRIGNHAQFNAKFRSKEELAFYVNNKFTPADPGEDKDYLISQMSIVEFDHPNPPKQARHDKRGRKRARKSK